MTSPEKHESHARPALSGRLRPLLVGRSRELLVLRAQLTEALAGNGSVVVLGGEAGIGKSRLANTLGKEASEAGALVLTGHCYDFTDTPPYGPWGELVERYASVKAQFPDTAAIPPPQLMQGTSHAALLSEVRDFYVAVARDRPLVILLEDMHWADAESFELLRFLARQLSSVPVLLLITYRNNEISRAHPLHRLVPLLVREALAVRIDVSPLTIEDVRALIDDAYRLPEEHAARLATYIQQRAEGNPFFVVELLRALEGTVLMPGADAGWALGALEQMRTPTLLRQVIDQRLARLGDDAEALLAIAAIIGQVVPFELWENVSGVPGPVLLDVVERAIDANVLDATPDGTAARFTHALIRDSIYDSVLPPRRRAWHLQIGEAVATSGAAADPDEVAYHLNQAGDPRAVEWLILAGERAQRAFAWRTAAQRFESALGLLEDDRSRDGERGWLRFRLALLRRFENPLAGVALLEDAERLGQAADDRALIAYARFFQGMLRCQADDFRLGVAAEEAGVALLDALDPHERARLLAIETTTDPLDAQNGRGELTLALAENARLHEARTLGEHIVSLPADQIAGSQGDAWYGLGYTYAGLGYPDEARRAFRQAREIFAADDHRSMVATSLFDELMLVVLPYQMDRPAERQRMESALAESLANLEDITGQGSTPSAYVLSSVLAGDWAGAFAMLEQSTWRSFRRNTPMLLAPIARVQGDTALAWSLIEQHFPAGPDTAPEDAALDTVSLRSLAVALALDVGDQRVARRWLTSFDAWLHWSGSVLGQADASLCWASYHRARGEREVAHARATEALEAASAPRQPLALLAANRLLGELDVIEGRLVDAEERLNAALTLAGTTGSAHELTRTLLAQAELLRAKGQLPAARELLDTVRARCLAASAVLTLAQADELATRLQARSHSSGTGPAAGLTPREIDVLRLLATGLPNAEIARQLSLSSRTIDTHLTSIYAKLGVTSRGAAIRIAIEQGVG